MESHLAQCRDCSSRWATFQMTVRMLRSLPPVAPDPAFVGAVLDRVRGFEADQRSAPRVALPGYPAPAHEPRRMWRVRSLLAGLWAVPEAILPMGFGWSRRATVPSLLAGATALGLCAGFFVSRSGVLPQTTPGAAVVASQEARTSSSSSLARPLAGSAVVSSRSTPDRPFGDLVGRLEPFRARRESTDAAGRQVAPEEPEFSPGDLRSPGRQVMLASEGRPQYVF